MSDRFPELEGLRVEVSEMGKARHAVAMDAALARRVTRRSRSPWRRRVVGAVVFAILALPTLGLAAEPAVPGDALYGVKRLIEPILAVFDDDLVARRRIDELEALLDGSASDEVVSRATAEAEQAVEDSGSDRLQERLDDATSDVPIVPSETTTTTRPNDRLDETPTTASTTRETSETDATRSDRPRTTEPAPTDRDRTTTTATATTVARTRDITTTTRPSDRPRETTTTVRDRPATTEGGVTDETRPPRDRS